jgi:hypothetical protein
MPGLINLMWVIVIVLLLFVTAHYFFKTVFLRFKEKRAVESTKDDSSNAG